MRVLGCLPSVEPMTTLTLDGIKSKQQKT